MFTHLFLDNEEEKQSSNGISIEDMHVSAPKPKTSTKKRETLTRKDVMQKTIFRALRKEYKYYFELFLKSNKIPVNYKINHFRPHIRQFIKFMMQWENEADLRDKFGEFTNLEFIVGLMVDFCKTKKMSKSRSERQLMAQFYDASYKYSHAKFERLLEIPEVKFLFKKMLDKDYIDMFLNCNKGTEDTKLTQNQKKRK